VSTSLHAIELRTTIGVTEEEQAHRQRILVDISYDDPNSGAVATTDELSSGIDYAAVAECVKKCGATTRKTLERLAYDIADALKQAFPTMQRLSVRVKKFPPIGAQSVSITIDHP
jgi:dihydroneopterin aldolase